MMQLLFATHRLPNTNAEANIFILLNYFSPTTRRTFGLSVCQYRRHIVIFFYCLLFCPVPTLLCIYRVLPLGKCEINDFVEFHPHMAQRAF